MKKIFLTATIIITGYCSYAQSFFTTSPYSSNAPQGIGATSLFGWGENFNRTVDVRPNPHPTYGTMMINFHTGLTFSAHSEYGGIRFYNQGYPNPYDPATGATMVMSIVNGNVGIGTTSPNGKLDVNGSILLLGSTNNTMTRPAVGTARIAGEISSYSADGLLAYDDGLLRLSAGGGTNPLKTFIDLSGYSRIPDMDKNLILGTAGAERVRIDKDGNVGIGTTIPDSKLAVNGTIHTKEVKVDLSVPGPDYVFEPTYKLPKLDELKDYLDKNHHLPEIPSAEQMTKDGINLGDMNIKLLKKVEELTLYLLEQQKQIDQLKKHVKLNDQRRP
jgi:hypothetical protein